MKRFISNEDFVRKFFWEALEEKHALRYLLVVASLVKTYGHKLEIDGWYLEIISKKHPDIAKLYTLLRSLDKVNTRDLNDIIKICKKIYVQYRKEFSIVADSSAHKDLTGYIHKQFSNADVISSETKTLGIDLKGEWYRYHRTIDSDLDTILWNKQ